MNLPIFMNLQVQRVAVVGKLSLNGGCTILGTEGEFTQVQSGEVKGYIPSQYLATDTNALLVALEVTYELADVKEDTTIYSDQDAESTPLMETTAGSRFLVTEKTLDWIKVQTEEDTYGYIPADKVSIIPELKMAEKVETIRTNTGKYKSCCFCWFH